MTEIPRWPDPRARQAFDQHKALASEHQLGKRGKQFPAPRATWDCDQTHERPYDPEDGKRLLDSALGN